ncbi:Brp/Blh family beta-carotene 15,15'-dioxygenase [Flavobacterium sp.]|uniref:Brp/Blh family beta-carotene 15,15'-dioxygenase n=1 Tax=Flavobacterium sp. TaxID=239 RepID=UPI00248A6587|nr:Brp/Blh family beta-carotene 15,15'-dioxygenase [Flavobacterium sp.]MDI1318058.1 Brp/Blh family beta-carotene 15,15'-dioxygenase [Flavobacterium sp.]
MSKNSNLSIVASFSGLWITSFFAQNFQIILGFILIFSFGILHGANDLVLLKKIDVSKRSISFKKLITSYIVVVSASALLFIIIPWLALLLFILVSGYHFGEQHWQELENDTVKWIKPLFQFNYGIFILLLLFVFHIKEVEEIVFSIIRINIDFIKIAYLVLFFGCTLIMFFVYFIFKSVKFKNSMIEELLYLVVFTILFKVGSLIWGFALYFIFWHSIPSLQDQIKFLYGKYSFQNFKLYFKSAFIYWITSLLGIVILYLIVKDETIFDALFFSFLAAITFPHAWVILKMFTKKTG